MNKQQLASRIWESANKMRSKIEANEYKDYILGFIFYKFLSDKEVEFLRENDWENEDFLELIEDDADTVNQCKRNLGYFISYNNLFSTWISMGKDFDASNVTDALSAFERLINDTHKSVFFGIFDTLQTGLSKLGETSNARTKAIGDLITLIKDIPMNEKQGYDPTSGSGSLLINIGQSASKYMNREHIRYDAQNAYPTVLRVDAVVSNPPYSQQWNPDGKNSEPRYSGYGLAPKSKADYAFLLGNYWRVFPNLKNELFEGEGSSYARLRSDNLKKTIMENADVTDFSDRYKASFADFDEYLSKRLELMREKWIVPLVDGLANLPFQIIAELEKAVETLSGKYAVTLTGIEEEIAAAGESLSAMIDDICGGDYDMQGLELLKEMLK